MKKSFFSFGMLALFLLLSSSKPALEQPAQPPSPARVAEIKVIVLVGSIHCLGVDDGRNDDTEEVYGKVTVQTGLASVEVTNGSLGTQWEASRENYEPVKKNRHIHIIKSLIYKFTIPEEKLLTYLDNPIAIITSDLEESDPPVNRGGAFGFGASDGDDHLNTPCGNDGCNTIVTLREVMNKTVKYDQQHKSGGTDLHVLFSVKSTVTFR